MRWWVSSSLARATAMVLLLWTAADLGFASLCALENEGGAAVVPIKTAATTVDSASPGPERAPQIPQHVDDCFCCSHCVDVQGLMIDTVSIAVARRNTPFVQAAPYNFGSRLYHPPLA